MNVARDFYDWLQSGDKYAPHIGGLFILLALIPIALNAVLDESNPLASRGFVPDGDISSYLKTLPHVCIADIASKIVFLPSTPEPPRRSPLKDEDKRDEASAQTSREPNQEKLWSVLPCNVTIPLSRRWPLHLLATVNTAILFTIRGMPWTLFFAGTFLFHSYFAFIYVQVRGRVCISFFARRSAAVRSLAARALFYLISNLIVCYFTLPPRLSELRRHLLPLLVNFVASVVLSFKQPEHEASNKETPPRDSSRYIPFTAVLWLLIGTFGMDATSKSAADVPVQNEAGALLLFVNFIGALTLVILDEPPPLRKKAAALSLGSALASSGFGYTFGWALLNALIIDRHQQNYIKLHGM